MPNAGIPSSRRPRESAAEEEMRRRLMDAFPETLEPTEVPREQHRVQLSAEYSTFSRPVFTAGDTFADAVETTPSDIPTEAGHYFNASTRQRIVDELTRGERGERAERVVKKMTSDDERAMARAVEDVLAARQSVEHRRNLSHERRESEYISLTLNDQRRGLTADDVRYSETAVHLDGISWELVKEIAHEGHKDIREVGGNLQIVCSVCDVQIPNFFAFFCLSSVYCPLHLPKAEECVMCSNIRTDCKEYLTPEGQFIQLCQRCHRKLRCSVCAEALKPEMALRGQCEIHYRQVADNTFPRHYSHNDRWMGEAPGALVQTNRIFSAELEVVLPSSRDVNAVFQGIPREVGASTDASIRSNGGFGMELQTPRLQGASGEELILRTTSALRSAKAVANESCGFHIHLDGADMLPRSRREYPTALLQLWKAHLVFEDVILSFLPYTRRLNRYCRPMRDYFKLSELSMLTSMFEVEKLWYKQRRFEAIAEDKGHHYHPSRYFGVNMHSLLGDRNLEIRYHTGTVNAKKIFHWVNLHALIMDASAAGIFTDDFLNEAQATTDLKEKTKMLLARIGLNDKSTRYFLERQRKFGDKAVNEDESVELPQPPRFIINSTGNF